MAGLMTHYICGEAVLNSLYGDIQKIIDKNRQIYNIGTQGPDIFFYYLPGHINKNIVGLGSVMHKGGINDFISYMLDESETGDEKEREACISYICGYLCHYAMDCNTHPYIYYKSGFKTKGKRGSRIKFSLRHRKLETNIDMILLKLFSTEKPSHEKVWQVLNASKKDCIFVCKSISNSIYKAYKINISPKQVYRAFGYMTNITRFFQYGKHRRKMMQFVENLTITDEFNEKLTELFKHDVDFFNLKKSNWYFPWDTEKQRVQKTSFTDMYHKSIEDTLSIIDVLVKYLCDEKTVSKQEVLDIIGNNSLSSGVDISENVVFSTYESIF